MLIERKTDIRNLQLLIDQFPITLLTGPRQCGKTTLAKTFDHELYLSFDSSSSYSKLLALSQKAEPCRGLVVLDEIQNTPETLPLLRQLVDSKKDIKFLLLGSNILNTRMELSKNLMGRMAHYEISGFTLDDVGTENLERHCFRGGMPGAFLAVDDSASSMWKREYLADYPHYSLAFSESGSSVHILSRFLTVLSEYTGYLVSFSNLARSLEVSHQTAKRYLDILKATGFIQLLPPYAPSSSQALRKKPKLYVRDTGLLAYLLGIEQQQDINDRQFSSRLWEAYAIEQLTVIIKKLFREQLKFWRGKSGMELDAIWEHKGNLIGIEIQARNEAKVTPNMRKALDALKLNQICVLYRGEDLTVLDSRIVAAPLAYLYDLLSFPQRKSLQKPALSEKRRDTYKMKVFVSYSHKDDKFVENFVGALESSSVEVTVDVNTLRLGDKIEEFIRKAVQNTEWTILVVSENSIRSPWVMAEFLETVLYERFDGQSRLIPICIDKSVFDLDLTIKIDKEIEAKISQVDMMIQEAMDRSMHLSPFVEVRERLLNLKFNVGKALERLTSVLMGDFSEPDQFTAEIAKLVNTLKTSQDGLGDTTIEFRRPTKGRA